ncbi:MAG: transglycosylase SLT domain-containing protein, partial [Firmicutes bacterium]|nr:transglycosylase SLT domain-containing protein [Bacillota bacterium]
MRRRMRAVTLGLILGTGLAVPWFGRGGPARAASLSSLEAQQQALEQQIHAERAAYNQAQATAAQLMGQIQDLSRQLNATQARMASTAQQLAAVEAQMARTRALYDRTQAAYQATLTQYTVMQAKLAATEKQLAYEKGLLTGQLRLIEEHGSVGYLDVLVGARTFQQFVSRMYLLGQVAGQAADEVATIRVEEQQETYEKTVLADDLSLLARRRAALAAAQSLLARQAAAAAALKAQEQAQALSLSAGISQRQQLMDQLRQQEASMLAAMSALRAQIAAVTAQIEQILGQFNAGGISRRQLYDKLYPLVAPIAARFGLSPALVIAVITQESGGNQSAVSSAGAIGLMQLEPATAAQIGVNPYDPYQNVVGGCTYLHDMLQL